MLVKSILVVVGITAGTAAGYGVLAKAAPDAAARIEGLLRDIGLGWDEASCQANPRACLTSRYEQLEALERQVGTSTGAIRAELDRVSRLVSDQEELVARNALFLEQGRDLYRKRDAEGAAAADAPIRFAGRTYPNRATFRAQLELLFQEKAALEASLASARELRETLQARLDALMVQEGQITLAKRMIPAQLQLVAANRALGEFGANVGMIDGVIRGSEAGLAESRALIATTRDLMQPAPARDRPSATREAFDSFLEN